MAWHSVTSPASCVEWWYAAAEEALHYGPPFMTKLCIFFIRLHACFFLKIVSQGTHSSCVTLNHCSSGTEAYKIEHSARDSTRAEQQTVFRGSSRIVCRCVAAASPSLTVGLMNGWTRKGFGGTIGTRLGYKWDSCRALRGMRPVVQLTPMPRNVAQGFSFNMLSDFRIVYM